MGRRGAWGGDRAGTAPPGAFLVAQGQPEPCDLHVRVPGAQPRYPLWIGCSSLSSEMAALGGSDSSWCPWSGPMSHQLWVHLSQAFKSHSQQGEDSRGSALLCKPRRDLRPWSGRAPHVAPYAPSVNRWCLRLDSLTFNFYPLYHSKAF